MIEDEKRLSAAIQRYVDDEISIGKAARAAGLSIEEFMEALGALGIACIRYDPGDLAGEVESIDE